MEEKRETLKRQVIELVKKFVAEEGGITMTDIGTLFGSPDAFGQSVSATLCAQEIKFE